MLWLSAMGNGCSYGPRSRDDRPHLQGLIDERDLDLAEGEFPGISSFYRQCVYGRCPCPRTFLELLARFEVFHPEG